MEDSRRGFEASASKSWADISWITDMLAVGACCEADRLADLADDDVGAVIDLRAEDRHDPEASRQHGIALLHLPTTDMEGADQADLDKGVEFSRANLESGRRVLIHCRHGIGRSALLALCVLVDRGHEPLAALRLAKDRRAVVSPSEAQYRAWAKWLARHGHEVPDYHSFGCIAYRHLAHG